MEHLEIKWPSREDINSALMDTGYQTSDMSAALTREAFGMYVSDAGTVGALMLGLDVSMLGKTPSTSSQRYDSTMMNTNPASIFVGPGSLRLDNVTFTWSTGHSVVLNTDLAVCTKL